ncbi:hypothetical protein ACHAXA_000501 [Cyclostephanos tholiformis]|uniref:Uncharacterized protein n=1 Tax=Cyclostephanos tholiformis TaxID=382380 RepID=A0ABD3STR1_9STRA
MSFSIGTSAVESVVPKMDMALDDIIKTTRRANPKKKNFTKNPNANAARATGQNKARRNASANARRGIVAPGGGRPDSMEVERQVKRAAAGGGGDGEGMPPPRRRACPGVGGGIGPVASPRRRRPRYGPRLAPSRASWPTGGGGGAIVAPTQQAIGAAARAMKEHGFRVPKGMQMQITFVPKKSPASSVPPTPPVFKTNDGGGGYGRGGGGRGGGGRGGRGGGGRGGGGRGGRHGVRGSPGTRM